MAEYVVVDVNAERRLVALLDRSGRYHVAVATGATPQISAQVRGYNPNRGFGLLIETSSRLIYRILFDAIDCSKDEALELLHGHPEGASPMYRNVAPTSSGSSFAAARTGDAWESPAPDRRADHAG